MAAKPGPLRPHEERLNYSRREPKDPPPGEPKLGDSFLILTEGEVTERLYFESVRQLLQVKPVTVRVIHPSYTDAMGLVRAAMKERDSMAESGRRCETDGAPDHVWVLFDTDVPARQGQLGPALELARKEGINVGHSTPSVEFWLLLHFRFTTGIFLTSYDAGHALGEIWGKRYNKREDTFYRLWPALEPNILAAVNRATQVREYHQSAMTPFPANPSTGLDFLIRALDAAIPPPMRILH